MLEQESQSSEAAREADRYYAAMDHTAKIEGEFLGMLDGLLVEPAQVRAAERAERVSQALITIAVNYGKHAAEHCRQMFSPAPPQAQDAPEQGVPFILR